MHQEEANYINYGLIMIEDYNGKFNDFISKDRIDIKKRPIVVLHYDLETDDVWYVKMTTSQAMRKQHTDDDTFTFKEKHTKRQNYIFLDYIYKEKFNKFRSVDKYFNKIGMLNKKILKHKEETIYIDDLFEEIKDELYKKI